LKSLDNYHQLKVMNISYTIFWEFCSSTFYFYAYESFWVSFCESWKVYI
jgi:hypothetical protein